MEAVEKHHLSPGVLGFIALISVAGLVFVGWLSSGGITGGAIYETPYYSCCTVEKYGSAPGGFSKGNAAATTEICGSNELPNRCCVRASRDRFKTPVRLINSHAGICPGPEVSYPSAFGGETGYASCCTVQTWRKGPTGLLQGSAVTSTESCFGSETSGECCVRAGAEKSALPVVLLGSKVGGCGAPEKAYPAPIAGGYTACCTAETWRQSSVGFTQGTAKSETASCDALETLSQCCARQLSITSPYPFKLLGFRLGSCSTGPVLSYPVWIR